MKCVICKQADTRPGTTTVTLERDALTLVVKGGARSSVCPNCGEEYVEEDVGMRLLEVVEQAAHAGVQVDVRQFVAA